MTGSEKQIKYALDIIANYYHIINSSINEWETVLSETHSERRREVATKTIEAYKAMADWLNTVTNTEKWQDAAWIVKNREAVAQLFSSSSTVRRMANEVSEGIDPLHF